MAHRIAGNGRDAHPHDRLILGQSGQAQNVGGDGLAFTIRVGCQIDGLRFLHGLCQPFADCLFAFDRNPLRRKVILHFNAQLISGQVADVTHRCQHAKFFAKK